MKRRAHRIGSWLLAVPLELEVGDAVEEFLWNELILTDSYGLGTLAEEGFIPNTVWDIGASVGFFAAAVAAIWPEAAVYCWEPNPAVAGKLSANAPRAVLRVAAAAPEAGSAGLLQWAEPVGHAGSMLDTLPVSDQDDRPREAARIEVALEAPWLRAPPPDLVKLDCEGSEWALLAALPCRPAIIVGEGHGTVKNFSAIKKRLQQIRPDYQWTTCPWHHNFLGRRLATWSHEEPVRVRHVVPSDLRESGSRPVCLAMASDAKGFEPNSTVIASVLRHTARPVHVRMWLRGMMAESFDAGRLRVEFLTAEASLDGQIPQHVTQSTFDRLLVLRDCPDWQRALVLDYDQLVLCDLGELFDIPMEENLIAGRLWHQTLGEAAAGWFGRQLPDKWRHCEGYPFFYMGPLLDLAAAREAGLWEKVVSFHRDAMMEEQIALTVACEGRIKALEPRWNLVPQWDKPEKPCGIFHFTGPQKPWDHPDLWGADHWREQETTWEELRAGGGSLRHPGPGPPVRGVNAA